MSSPEQDQLFDTRLIEQEYASNPAFDMNKIDCDIFPKDYSALKQPAAPLQQAPFISTEEKAKRLRAEIDLLQTFAKLNTNENYLNRFVTGTIPQERRNHFSPHRYESAKETNKNLKLEERAALTKMLGLEAVVAAGGMTEDERAKAEKITLQTYRAKFRNGPASRRNAHKAWAEQQLKSLQ